MGVLRQYQTYHAISLEHWSIVWSGDTYSKLLVKDYPSEYLVSDDYVTDNPASFIYPSSYASKYYLDGIAEGHISIFNTSTTNDDAGTVTQYSVKLESLDNNGSEPTTIFDITRSVSSEGSVPSSDYLSLPIYATIDKKLVEADQKLRLTISFAGADPSSGNLYIACANDSANVDVEIRVPYAPSG